MYMPYEALAHGGQAAMQCAMLQSLYSQKHIRGLLLHPNDVVLLGS